MIKKPHHELFSFLVAAILIGTSFFLAYMPRNSANLPSAQISNFAFLEDPDGQLSIEDIQSRSGDFTAGEKSTFFHARTKSAFWLKFTVNTHIEDNSERILEILNSNMEKIDVYFPGHPAVHMGRKADIRTVPLKTRTNAVQIPRDVKPDETVFMRVETTTIMQVPLKVRTAVEVINTKLVETLIYGLFFGIILAVFFVNLFSLFLLKNKNFRIYLFYLFSLLIYQLRVHGFMFLIPMPYSYQAWILWISLAGVGIFMMLFAKKFLGLKKRLPVINWILNAFIVLFILQTIIGCFFSNFWANQIAYITGFLVPLIIIISTAVIYVSGYREARYYLLAWVALFTGTLIWSTAPYAEAQIPSNYFLIIGTSIDSILFTLAIFDQIKTELMEKAAIIESEKYYIDLSRKDSLTGLYNRRYLDDIVRRLESEDSISDQHAVIMIDLDNFKNINDTYGHPTGDIVLIHVSLKIKSHIRKTDIACRYGGDEFLIYLPGASVQTANIIAAKICTDISENHCYDQETGDLIQNTVSIGITENRNNDSFDASFLRADAALYKAKKSGRNCIAVL